MEEFSSEIDKYNKQAKRGYDISFSYGVVEYDPAKHDGVAALLADGDDLMYEFKKELRDTTDRPLSVNNA